MTTPNPTPTTDPAAGAADPPTSDPAAVKPTEEPTVDPIAKLQNDPNALATLLSQVQQLTNKLGEVSTERDTFKQKEEQQRRSQQTKEEQIQTDLENERIKNEKLFNILKTKIVENAISNAKGFEWHSVKQVMAELNPEAFEVDVDVDSLTGTVSSGIEAEIKRIAQQCPWLVSKDKTAKPQDGQQQQPRRPSGSPVAPPQGDAAKMSKREALIKKYPVIVQGKA